MDALLATLLARIDAPGVDDREGVALAKSLHSRCQTPETSDLFELALAKPHFRRWWTSVNAKSRVTALMVAMSHDDADEVRAALADMGDALDVSRRTQYAIEAIEVGNYATWREIVASGPIDELANLGAYFDAAIHQDVDMAVLNDGLERLTTRVVDGAVARQAALERLRLLQLHACERVHFPSILQACTTCLERLYTLVPAAPVAVAQQQAPVAVAQQQAPVALEMTSRQAVIESLFEYDANGSVSSANIWKAGCEHAPHLFGNRKSDFIVIGRYLHTKYGGAIMTRISKNAVRAYKLRRRV